jgi:hypothetical protein
LTCWTFCRRDIASETAFAFTSFRGRVREGKVFRIKGETNVPADQPLIMNTDSLDLHLLLVFDTIGMIIIDDILDDCRSSVMGRLGISPIHHVVSHEIPIIKTFVYLCDNFLGE